MSRPVFRFAPSPNGLLHLGHACSALVNQRLARESGGVLLLRIEDLDTVRCTPENEAMMLEDLAWIGFGWDGEPRRQSEHFAEYGAALTRLLDDGLAYRAFMSRGDIRREVARRESQGASWPADPDGAPLYPGDERGWTAERIAGRVAARDDHAFRLDMARALARIGGPLFWEESGQGPGGETGRVAADPAAWGDVVLGRRDAPASYHLACVLDDAVQGVTDVVRGMDLFHATAVHRVLQEVFGQPAPRYRHHRLILGADGRKLSKSRHSTALRHLREAGVTARQVRAMVGLD